MRELLMECADDLGGMPMPIPEVGLTLHPAFPRARELADVFEKPRESRPVPGVFRRNIFWSTHHRGYVHVWSEGGELGQGGTLKWTLLKGQSRFQMEMRTMRATFVWGARQEWKANEKLSTLIDMERFKGYAMCGMFEETSLRSGVRYVFRKLKPTIAISERSGREKVLACLCLHPIGYYKGSFAGAMVPTDDVIAHLLMMRTDEAGFWRDANHHSPDRTEAGL
ncbi:MAG: hypothetical protein JSR66_09885 [Proteobacteria bacterium]|nr:hypothetical protein [Pseudomonadota bacterium]